MRFEKICFFKFGYCNFFFSLAFYEHAFGPFILTMKLCRPRSLTNQTSAFSLWWLYFVFQVLTWRSLCNVLFWWCTCIRHLHLSPPFFLFCKNTYVCTKAINWK